MSLPLRGNCALITGANRGLGLEIARSLVRAGAGVMLCARDGAALRHVAEELQREASEGQRVLWQAADVSSANDVTRLVERAISELPGLHVLVNNAGIYGPMGAIEDVDWKSWVEAIEINLLGSVLMARAVVPHFKRQRYGKIIQLSGGGATNPMPRISAYAVSKAAVIRFAETLAEECREFGIDVNAIAPGALNTRLLDQVLSAGPEAVGPMFYEQATRQKADGGAPLQKGADLAVFLASQESNGITGRLVSAVWDPWETLPQRRAELAKSDVYTLRRIVPKDRGMDWGER